MTDFTSHEAPAHEAQSLPVMLPSKLIGRDLVLAKIYTELKNNMPVQIYGVAGIGKTALAATLASAYTDLPGGVLWMNAHNPTLPDLIVQVGRAYDVPEIMTNENPLSMVGAVANVLMQHKPLVVIDGAVDEATATEFVNRCADHLPLLLVTDEQMVGPWVKVGLEDLEADQALAMFEHLAGMETPSTTDDDADVDELIALAEYNPFGLAVAAGCIRYNKQPVAEYLQQVPQQQGVSGPLRMLTASFRGLNSALQGLMLIMGATLRGEASAELVSMISNVPQDSIHGAMNLLAQRHLVARFTRYGAPYYRLHPITYAFTQPLLRGSGKLDTLRAKVRESLLAYAKAHSSANDPDYDRLAAEMDNLLALARWDAEQGDRDTANQIAVALMQAGDFINARGYVYELLLLRRLAVAPGGAFPAHGSESVAGAGPLPYDEVEDEEDLDLLEDEEDEDEAYPSLPYDIAGADDEDDDLFPGSTAEPVLTAAGAAEDDDLPDDDEGDLPEDTLEDEGDEDEAADLTEGEADEDEVEVPQESAEIARLRTSLMQARQQGNLHRQAELLNQIGQTQVRESMENEAISSYSEALTAYEAIEDRNGILNTLETLARLTAKTDNLQAAVLHATRGVNLAESAGDRERQIRLLIILGDARQQLGESEQAVAAYEQALVLARQQDDEDEEAAILLKLGYAQLDDGSPQAAIDTWEAALSLFREANRRDAEGRVLGGLGTAYGDLNRWTEAIAFHTSALHIAREVGDPEEEALQLSNLGYASVQANHLGDAVLRYRQALHLAYEANNRDNIVSTIVDLAQLLMMSRKHLSIAELLVDDAVRIDPSDRDVKRLKEQIGEAKQAALNDGVALLPVTGTTQDYASNAYALLEEA